MLAGSSNPQAAGRRSFGALDTESGLTAARDAAGNKTGCSAADPPRDAAGMAGRRPPYRQATTLTGSKRDPGRRLRAGAAGTGRRRTSAPPLRASGMLTAIPAGRQNGRIRPCKNRPRIRPRRSSAARPACHISQHHTAARRAGHEDAGRGHRGAHPRAGFPAGVRGRPTRHPGPPPQSARLPPKRDAAQREGRSLTGTRIRNAPPMRGAGQ